jgi:hypothetical protein
MAAALLVTVLGIAASAAAGAEVGSDECVEEQERILLEEGVWSPRAPLTVQHAQQSGDPEPFGQRTADEHC